MRHEKQTIEVCGIEHVPQWMRTDAGEMVPRLRFNGNVALTNLAAGSLSGELARQSWDVLVGVAPRCLPLLHVLSSFLGRENYVPVHRSCRGDLHHPIGLGDEDGCPWSAERDHLAQLNDAAVMLVTDVAWNPDPLRGLSQQLQNRGIEVAGHAAVLVTGDLAAAKHYHFAGTLDT